MIINKKRLQQWKDTNPAELMRERDDALTALKIIYTWATSENGVAFDRKRVAELCSKTLWVANEKV